jgi:hypothetical protein
MMARRMRSKEELVLQVELSLTATHMKLSSSKKLHETVIKPVLRYTSESWTLAKKSESALDAFERKVLRRILGQMKENNTWRIIYSDEFCKKFEEPSVSNIIKLKRP